MGYRRLSTNSRESPTAARGLEETVEAMGCKGAVPIAGSTHLNRWLTFPLNLSLSKRGPLVVRQAHHERAFSLPINCSACPEALLRCHSGAGLVARRYGARTAPAARFPAISACSWGPVACVPVAGACVAAYCHWECIGLNYTGAQGVAWQGITYTSAFSGEA